MKEELYQNFSMLNETNMRQKLDGSQIGGNHGQFVNNSIIHPFINWVKALQKLLQLLFDLIRNFWWSKISIFHRKNAMTKTKCFSFNNLVELFTNKIKLRSKNISVWSQNGSLRGMSRGENFCILEQHLALKSTLGSLVGSLTVFLKKWRFWSNEILCHLCNRWLSNASYLFSLSDSFFVIFFQTFSQIRIVYWFYIIT